MNATQHSMDEVQAAIEARRKELEHNPFLPGLDGSSDLEDLRAIAPHLFFYVFGFQDMLRLTRDLIKEPGIAEIATTLREEDAGHEQWYLFDIEQLECERDTSWLFGAEHQPTRDIVYLLIGELLKATDDRVRLVFPLVLEAAGSVFFFRVVGLLQRSGYDKPLRYFARSHQEVESEHDIFSEGGQAGLDQIAFDDRLFEEAVGLISRCFDYFERFADHLERCRRAVHK